MKHAVGPDSPEGNGKNKTERGCGEEEASCGNHLQESAVTVKPYRPTLPKCILEENISALL